MDFFRYLPITEQFSLLDYYWVQYIVGALFFLVVYVFETIGLYTIASRNGYKNKWMAFIPFLNTYYIGVCAQKNKFYRVSAKTLGLIVAVIEFLIVALYVFKEVAFNILRIKGYIQTEVETIYMFNVENYVLSNDTPANLQWATWLYSDISTFIFSILDMIYFVPKLLLLICFFQTYASRRYILFAIFSALFPIMGILIFVVRKNKAVNYRDFMRAEQARQYQQYQQYRQQNYNNPYNQNPYNGNPYNNPRPNGGSGSDPFDGFGGNANDGNRNTPPSDPFEDFDK